MNPETGTAIAAALGKISSLLLVDLRCCQNNRVKLKILKETSSELKKSYNFHLSFCPEWFNVQLQSEFSAEASLNAFCLQSTRLGWCSMVGASFAAPLRHISWGSSNSFLVMSDSAHILEPRSCRQNNTTLWRIQPCVRSPRRVISRSGTLLEEKAGWTSADRSARRVQRNWQYLSWENHCQCLSHVASGTGISFI